MCLGFGEKRWNYRGLPSEIPADYMRNSRGLHAAFPRTTCGISADYLRDSEFAGVLPAEPLICGLAGCLRLFLRVWCGFSAYFLRIFCGSSAGFLRIFCGRFVGNLRTTPREFACYSPEFSRNILGGRFRFRAVFARFLAEVPDT